MSDPQWVQCRLRRSTLERLREWSKTTLKEVRYVATDNEEHKPESMMGVDVAVSILLDRDIRHRERSRKQRK